jgi:putative hemolysin
MVKNNWKMSLINDSELRKILKIKESQGKWFVALVRMFLGIEKLNQIYNENHTLSGLEFIDSILNKLKIKYSISDESITNIPATGPFIIISNHPLGGIDGLLLLKIICEIRPDFKLQGNFLLHKIEPVRNYILPVNPFGNFKSAKSSYSGIKAALTHLKDGKSLGIFPAGEVSSYQIKDFKITDRQWQKSSIHFIQKAGVPVIPIYFQGFNSLLFYLLGQIHPILRTARLPSEIFNKGKQTVKIQVRKPIKSKTISSFTNLECLTQFLRIKTYSLNKSVKIETFFKFKQQRKEKPKQAIIKPIAIELIQSDLNTLTNEYLLFSHGSFSVYCAPFNLIQNIIQEIGRLREITFREVGEGTNKSVDLDPFDIYYNHLIIWDNEKKQIIGSYRIGKGKDILNQYGRNGFYISTLFKMKREFDTILDQSIELGRSFIIKEYQRHPLSLFLLWKGILWYLMNNPDYHYLIGPVSISNDFSKRSKSLIVQFINGNYFDYKLSAYIKPRKKFRISKKVIKMNNIILDGIDNNLKTLDLYINEFQPDLSIPVLLKKYLQINGKIIGFNTDPDFNNCLDGFMLVNVSDIPFEMLDHLGRELEASQVRDRFK